ncbi:MAG: M20/M25/M40 family metallo-hydrolase [Gemmatimonadetes bacterium]|nr:M20/M25/M40 family metallo-hydrolase [Gemmatimonadota bacterium]
MPEAPLGAGPGARRVHDNGPPILEAVRDGRDAMLAFLVDLASLESPTDDPARQRPVQDMLAAAFEELGGRVRRLPGRDTGGHLFIRFPGDHGSAPQLLVGHTDTVWPVGTLREMPVRVEDGVVHGPGVFDMKAGLTQMVFALRALRELGLRPPVPPVVLVNSDEELGSFESRRWVARLARVACRAFVLEPALGPDGRLKTRRKGVGRYEITVRGKAAHAGLDPDAGASAVLGMAHVIQALHALSDRGRGISVNVGVVEGGTRPNVVAAEAVARVDVRVTSRADGDRLDRLLRDLSSPVEGTRVEVEGGMEIPPLEATPRNRRLWEAAREAGSGLGLALEEAAAGGASDGNTTSLHTATLDGLGAPGDGAHARHEHVHVDGLVERCALLARLLLLPREGA